MKFLSEDFLLESEMARTLFHNYAEDMPIIDYHCHLEPQEIYENKKWENLTQVWLGGDHYKWRLLRAMGISEELITGNGEDYEKFFAFAETLEHAYGNPIHEWTHLELKRYFGIDKLITRETAKEIWDQCNEILQLRDFTPRMLIKNSRVQVVVTTDDPTSSLKYHKMLAEEETDFKVLPGLRPDFLIEITNGHFDQYLKELSEVVEQEVISFDDIVLALEKRFEYFAQMGGRLSDHSLSTYYYARADKSTLDKIIIKARENQHVTTEEFNQYITELMLAIMSLNKKFNWTMQLHLNVNRSINGPALKSIGVNSGFDTVGTQANISEELTKLFSAAADLDVLPKMILYSLNPNDQIELATMIGCFQGEQVQKMQIGAGWWFNDTAEGMYKQLETFASQSLLSNFVGMLTDSRSFLSYPRHEYFRRVLCNFIGNLSEAGRVPDDEKLLGKLVQNIAYNNACHYFRFFED
ncbi:MULTISPECIES: glucuronate isomerase [Lactococcus]|jgi:glucuronate isomerase|uniref:Uronate isomerase n=1 Tax=Lactococcus formosensis TaxID=1281486 RepID=A0A9Q8Y3T0_9LACT|nr:MULTISPECIES: glucuronate isomerase [Lactococcus]USI66524.1 glucuronate isomerase [Lactococcus petauri]USI68968.1 glucuronate isomerase [Lactococcus petauri]USJ21155.1 glucuronate isomerase [Lactococcus formosensis]WJE13635.1 glucuronate isomerase [Lactococcus petauri]